MRTSPEKIAIPRFGEEVAPCFEYSATIAIFRIEDARVVEELDFTLTSRRALDRIRLLRDQQVDVLICGGLQDRYEDLVSAGGIRVLSWVHGEVEELLKTYLRGELVDGRANRHRSAPLPFTPPPGGRDR